MTVAAAASTAIAAGAVAAASPDVQTVPPEPAAEQASSEPAAEPVAEPSAPQVVAETKPESDSIPSDGADPAGDPVPLYRKALSQLTDMTADMASNFEQIKWVDGKMVVTLVDAYNTTMCSRPDRKSKIESAVGEIAGRTIRIDFVASKNQPVAKTTAPKLSRVQQIRELQEHEFVKEAVDLFDCEITDFYRRN